MSAGPSAPWWPNVVTWLLVLAGWFAVHLATLARERRKERRELAADAVDALRELESEAVLFHSATSFDSISADRLIYNAGRIIRSLQRVPINALNIPLWRMVRVRRSITLNNCDSSSFKTQAIGSQFFMDIRAAVDDLTDSIEECRDTQWK